MLITDFFLRPVFVTHLVVPLFNVPDRSVSSQYQNILNWSNHTNQTCLAQNMFSFCILLFIQEYFKGICGISITFLRKFRIYTKKKIIKQVTEYVVNLICGIPLPSSLLRQTYVPLSVACFGNLIRCLSVFVHLTLCLLWTRLIMIY